MKKGLDTVAPIEPRPAAALDQGPAAACRRQAPAPGRFIWQLVGVLDT